MRFLFVMDPIASVNPAKDTTFAFIEETQARGIETWVCGIHELSALGAQGFAHATRISVQRPAALATSHHTTHESKRMSFDDFAIIWMRKDPPVDDKFLFACMLLDRADPTRTVVLNNPTSLRIAHEKLWGLFAPELGPQTLVSSNRDELVEFAVAHQKVVLKPLHAMGGLGILVFESGDRNLKSAIDLLSEEGRRPMILQQYLPAVRDGDKRVILLDGNPIGALNRVPADDDHRANLHIGGSGNKGGIGDAEHAIAQRLKPELDRLGLFFVGLDVIGGKVTEINVTSPTGVQEIDRLDARVGDDRLVAQVIAAAIAKVPA